MEPKKQKPVEDLELKERLDLAGPTYRLWWSEGRCHWEVRMNGDTEESDFCGYADSEEAARHKALTCALRHELHGIVEVES